MSTRFGSGKVQIIASDRKIVEMAVSRIFDYASLWYNGSLPMRCEKQAIHF